MICEYCNTDKLLYAKGLCRGCYMRQLRDSKRKDKTKDKINDAQKTIQHYAEILCLLSAGKTYQEVADKYNISRQSIWSVVDKLSQSETWRK